MGNLAVAAAALLTVSTSIAQDWPRWALNPQHTGNVGVAGQPLKTVLASITYDPLVPQELAANQNGLQAHYQVLLSGSGKGSMIASEMV